MNTYIRRRSVREGRREDAYAHDDVQGTGAVSAQDEEVEGVRQRRGAQPEQNVAAFLALEGDHAAGERDGSHQLRN